MKLNIKNKTDVPPNKVKLVTYRYNWADIRLGLDEEEIISIPNQEGYTHLLKELTQTNQRLKIEAKKKKANYYLVKFIEAI